MSRPSSGLGSAISDLDPGAVRGRRFSAFARSLAALAGRPSMFVAAVLAVAAWALSGPLFGFSDTWQLVINTGTTIVTFLMVFLIQNTQNRDSLAIQVKLDELVRALETANNKFVGIEDLTEEEVEKIRKDVVKASAAQRTPKRRSRTEG